MKLKIEIFLYFKKILPLCQIFHMVTKVYKKNTSWYIETFNPKSPCIKHKLLLKMTQIQRDHFELKSSICMPMRYHRQRSIII